MPNIGMGQRGERHVNLDDYTFTWGEEPFSIKLARRHMAMLGATGSGKTLTIRNLMEETLGGIGTDHPAIPVYQRALIYDSKQDMLTYLLPTINYERHWALENGNNPTKTAREALEAGWLPRTIRILNPFDRRCSSWNMAADVKSPASALQVASILVPENKGEHQPFFTNAVRHLLYGVMMAFIDRNRKANWKAPWTFRDLLLSLRSVEDMKAIFQGCDYTRHLTEMYLNPGETLDNIKSSIASKMMPYEIIAAAWSRAKSQISLEAFVQNPIILILGNDEQNREAVDAINRVIFKRLSELIISQPDNEDACTWIILDEVREMGKLDGLSSLLLRGRSKGANIVLGFQDIEGLKEVYGENQALEIMGQCGFKAFLRLESPTTAEWAAKHFGVQRWVEKQKSSNRNYGADLGVGTGTSDQRTTEENLLYSEFMTLLTPDMTQGYICGYYTSPRGTLPRVQANNSDSAKPVRTPAPARPSSSLSRFAVLRRGAEDQYLEPWSAEERRLIGAAEPKSSSKQSALDGIARGARDPLATHYGV